MEANSTIDLLEVEYRVDGSCWKFVPVVSEGLFSTKSDGDILSHPLLLLQVQLSAIFILASLIHYLFFRRFHLPRLISEVLSGLILGPTVLGKFFPEISNIFFSQQSMNAMYSLPRFGYLFFMFLIGVKMDITLIAKAGRREWTIGALVIIIPMMFIVAIAKRIAIEVDNMVYLEPVALYSGTLMLTSFPVVACFLMDQKIINSELGHLALSSALISDLISVVIVNFDAYGLLIKLASLRVALKSMFLCIAVVMIITTILRQVMYWIIRRTPEGKPVRDSHLCLMVIAMLVVAVVGDNVGLQYMYGPFIMGLTVPPGPPLASVLIEKLDTIVAGWMLPLVSTYCGYRSNLWDLMNKKPPASFVFSLTVGLMTKIASGFIPAICFKMPFKDAAALAFILTANGVVELGTFATNADKQSLNSQQFTFGVVTVLVLAAVVPILTRMLYDPSKTYTGYQKRTVLNASPNEALRVLACAHGQDDALSAIKLLELSNPSNASILSVYGLYLEELIRGSTPQLLNHQLGQKSSSGSSRWQPIVDVFKYFKLRNMKQTQVQVFTAISPAKLMHEDICWIAFSNLVALIIIPFHKKWDTKGKLISDNKDRRALNCKVLNKAPCSVGVWIDHSKIRGPSVLAKSSAYKVCVVYLGGKDDREALAIARRMRGWPSISLTVVRLISIDDWSHQGWESMLDDECLRDIKHQGTINGNVWYKEQRVKDGADTSMHVGSLLEENYDLILAGRHSQTKSPIIEGLGEWSELPELGPIGDILASADATKPVSVFVVQQQITADQNW